MRKAIIVLLLALTAAHAKARWVAFGVTTDQEIYYYDAESLYYTSSQAEPGCACYATVWEKHIEKVTGKQILTHLEFHRTSRHMRVIEGITYDASGKVTDSTRGSGVWFRVVPDSIGELLFDQLFPPERSKPSESSRPTPVMVVP